MLLVGRLPVHGIGSRRMMARREVLVAQSNYKRPYLGWLRNLVCGDSTGSDGVRKDRFVFFHDLFGAWSIETYT